jgi:hypothetical protein
MTDDETKRIQINTPVNIRSAEKLGLVDDEGGDSAARLRVDLPQDSLPIDQTCKESAGNFTDNLRTRIIAVIAKADQDWCSDNGLHEDMADAVMQELEQELNPPKPTFNNEILSP